jgi:hypothetical protein
MMPRNPKLTISMKYRPGKGIRSARESIGVDNWELAKMTGTIVQSIAAMNARTHSAVRLFVN